METTKDFLVNVSAKKLKKEINNICDSYSNPWDILAELCQNSVDAIKKWKKENPTIQKDHKIEIKIVQDSKKICVYDTGTGILPDKAPALFGPNNGDKDEDDELVGEKGVGLTFAIFTSNNFTIDTISVKGHYKANVTSARIWRSNSDFSLENIPKVRETFIEEKEEDPKETMTLVELSDVDTISDESTNIFNLNFERLEYLIQTKTAIGNTEKRFKGNMLDIKITLALYQDESSLIKKNEIKFEYKFPDTFYHWWTR